MTQHAQDLHAENMKAFAEASTVDGVAPPDAPATLPERLWTAAEQIRLTATVSAALAQLVDEDDTVLLPHVERLEHRAAELMRTALRLARDVGVAGPWGLDVLFAGPDTPTLLRPVPAAETIELDDLPLMAPVPPPVTARPLRLSVSPVPPEMRGRVVPLFPR